MQMLLSLFRRVSILAAGAVLGVVLPSCALQHPSTPPEAFTYDCTATLRLADGSTVNVTNNNLLLGGGSARVFAEPTYLTSEGTPRARALDNWKRYVARRLSAPSPSDTFQAEFGAGPWCLLSADATVTTRTVRGARPDVIDPIAPLAFCTVPPVPQACANAAGVVPILDVTPSAVDFGAVPVGTLSPETVVTVSNVGAGRLCLYGPTLNATSPNRGDFLPLDASDCAPRTTEPEEMRLGLTILDAARPACNVRVHVTPRHPSPRAARLRLNSTDPMRAFVDVPLTASGEPGMLLFRDNRCFNVASVGGCYPVRHAILNNGPGHVTILSVALPAEAMAAGWSIAGYATTGGVGVSGPPITLTPGNLLAVDLQVCSATAPDATLMVLSNSSTPLTHTTLQGPSSGCTP